MIKKVGLSLVVLIALIFGYAAIQPSRYVISRETTINAPVEKIFPYLNNSKLADQWGPWKEVDPQATMKHDGPDAGVGSRTSWDSSGQLGTGSATITESTLNQRVAIHLAYTKPMAMTQESEYLARSSGPNQSVVTWRVQGENSVMGRLMCLFMNMDKMVGGMFEKGLANLKALVEKTSLSVTGAFPPFG